MLKHIVFFKLQNPTPELLQKTADVLRSMEGNVPMLRGIEVGVDVLKSQRSYDISLQVTLDDLAALEAYQRDSYHTLVVCAFLHTITLTSVAVDYVI